MTDIQNFLIDAMYLLAAFLWWKSATKAPQDDQTRSKKYLEPIEFEKLDFDNKKMVAGSLIDKIYIY